MREGPVLDNPQPRSATVHRYAHPACLVLLAVLGLWIFFSRLEGSLSLWDEAYYGAVAKYSLENGLVLFPAPQPGWRSDKPALYFWILELSFLLFGTNSFALRFPSAAGAFASYLLLYLLGRRFFGTRVGFISALLLLTSGEFHVYPRNSLLDPIMLAMQLGFALCATRGRPTRSWDLFGGAVLLGLLFFLKQALGVAVLFPVLFYWWYSGEWPKAKPRDWGIACALFLVTGFGWYAAAWTVDSDLAKNLLFGHNLAFRFSEELGADPWFWANHFTDRYRQGSHPILYMGVFAFLWCVVEWRRKPSAALALFGFWLWALTIGIHVISFRALQYSVPLYALLSLFIALIADRLWTRDWNGVDLIAVGWSAAFLLFIQRVGWLSQLKLGNPSGLALAFGVVLGLFLYTQRPKQPLLRSLLAWILVGAALWIPARLPNRADHDPQLQAGIERLIEEEGADQEIHSTFFGLFHLLWYHEGPSVLWSEQEDGKVSIPPGEGYLLSFRQDFDHWPENRFEVYVDAGTFKIVRFFPPEGPSSP